MKKILILFTTVTLSFFAAQAQTTTFGFKVGAQANNLPLKFEALNEDVTLDGGRTGFHAGGIADISFNPNFSIQPNLLFSLKGGGFFTEGKINIFAIDVPINFLYKHNGFFIGAGPNFSYGLSAKLKPYDSAEEDTDLYEDPDGPEEAPFNRFEFGVNALMGYQFPSGLTLSTTFNRGFTSILNEDDVIGTDSKLNTRFFGFSIGYMFNKTAAKKK